MEPADFQRRVLLVVSGMSPQILTETLWALTQNRQPAFVPTEIRMLTTASGSRNARLNLLEKGYFARFCLDYGIEQPLFNSQQIEIIKGADQQPLEDIRTPEENSAAADHITEVIRHYTQDDNCSLHVSMAGGRKTMGYYAGYALSLFAREQDRLSHVLVSEGFENLPSFYYPTRTSELIDAGSNKVLDAKEAKVTLAEIPFVRLRDEVPTALLKGQASFSRTIAIAQRINEPAKLCIDLSQRKITAAGENITLPPILFAVYAWLTERSLRGETVGAPDLVVANAELGQELAVVYQRIVDQDYDVERTLEVLNTGIDRDWFDEKKSRINSRLAEILGKTGSSHLRV